jgi:thiosulfate/3-mercaptopyruvate sulfurtransferase
VPHFEPTGYHAAVPDFSIRAYAHDVRATIGASGHALVDVRSPAEYTGQVIAPPGMSETAQRAGHVPGAANVPWAQAANEDGSFKSAAELAALYGGKGVTPDHDVIAYCRIGERSSHTWFVLRELLGYKNVRNYDGSWTEWGNLIGAPIANPSAAH